MGRLSNIKTGFVVLLVIWAVSFSSYIWYPRLVSQSAPTRGFDTQEVVHVVITSDSHTVGGMVTLINSIVSNTHSPVVFHLITDAQTSPHLRTWLMQTKLWNINFEIKEFPMEWLEGKIKVRGGRMELANPLNYARFYLPDLFPGIDGRMVYIDDDCIVQGDIAELFHMRLKPGTLAAFSEDCKGVNRRISFMQNVYADFFDLKNQHFLELDIDPGACAFNTGVFITNLTEWRRQGITDKLLYWLELNTKEELYGNERGGGGSQPPMMLVFYKKYTPLDLLWHVHFLGWTPRTRYTAEFIGSAKLLHWNGRFKPWGRVSSYQHIWDRYFLPDPTHKFQPVRRGGVL
ncbi:glycosyltransferase 8 domain-containing protein 1-like isoform X2 [Babylonia areolata]|uniref:glycosyltransferase 8 domain-containing protein 1-like isoform X2 n=1 Tax=Babylonia areolata TaxID=304850 RepID=UPI003FD57E73